MWVELKGPKILWQSGGAISAKTVLIVYDPDPIYNFDEQVCLSFAQGFVDRGIKVNVATVAATEDLKSQSFDAYVFCANTYNWHPDWALSKFIKNQSLNNKPVIAITVGSGNTSLSQEALEEIIANSHGKILASRSFWLMKPNDKKRIKEANVNVAKSMVNAWATEIAGQIQP